MQVDLEALEKAYIEVFAAGARVCASNEVALQKYGHAGSADAAALLVAVTQAGHVQSSATDRSCGAAEVLCRVIGQAKGITAEEALDSEEFIKIQHEADKAAVREQYDVGMELCKKGDCAPCREREKLLLEQNIKPRYCEHEHMELSALGRGGAAATGWGAAKDKKGLN